MRSQRAGRSPGEPLATLTVYRDDSDDAGHPSAQEVEEALEMLYPSDRFSIEHRALLIDGSTHVLFEIYEAGIRRPGRL